MRHLLSNRFRFTALLPVGLLLASCGGEQLSLGGDGEVPPVDEVLCNGGVFTGDAFVQSQEDVDAMLGCEEVMGTLTLQVSSTQGLEPLGSLRIVHGRLRIKGAGSLAGLEALEQVSGLELSGLRSTDLTGLSGLTRVAYDPLGSQVSGSGGITIEYCDALQDLRGLENLRSWDALTVEENGHLQSLAGLQTPPILSQVTVTGCNELTDLSALAPLVQVGGFILGNSEVENFEGFRLWSADEITLYSNSELRDLDGLLDLSSVERLSLIDNDRLVRIELPALTGNSAMSIIDNDALLAVPRYDLFSAAGDFGSSDGNLSAISNISYLIEHNTELTSIAAPLEHSTPVQHVAIWDNPKLTTLDLGGIPAANTLSIMDNTALRDVQTSPTLDAGGFGLTRVGDLEVVNNPALSTAAFDSVQTFTRTFSGNLDEPAPE